LKFEDVIGQEGVKSRLRQMLDEDRVPHAILLCGPSGSGLLAIGVAMACELLRIGHEEDSLFGGGGTDPVTEAMLNRLEHPDLHFSYPTIKEGSGSDRPPISDDFAREWHELIMQSPYFTIDQWMAAMGAGNQQAIITAAESDELSHKLSLKSSQGGYKVSVIWLPERMNQQSANKLLKLLEEPPLQTVFILVSEAPEQLLETIRSRTQRISVPPIATADVEKALIERRALNEEDAHRIARVANGNWFSALSALDADSENRQFLDMFILLMRLAYGRKIKELKSWSETVTGFGREKQRRMLVYFMSQVRENFMYNFHEPELNYLTQDEENFARNFAKYINEANVVEIEELFERVHRDIGQNANAKIEFFDLCLQMILLLIKK